MRVAIVEYGAGNLASVQGAVVAAGGEPFLAVTPEQVATAERLILPGVGAAGTALAELRRRGLEDALADAALRRGRPFLGICLGAQMLSRAAGGTVAPHAAGLYEVGYFPIHATDEGRDLFAGCTHAYQWHKDGFEIPRGAVRLATGERFENQAFRIGEHAFGLQFHPEVTPKTMEQWQGFAEKKQLPGAQTVAELVATRDRHEHRTRRWLYRFLDHWLGAPGGALQNAA